MFRLFASLLTASVLSACGPGDGSGMQNSGGGNSLTTGLEPTLASIQANVFTPTCAITGCHGGVATQAALHLDPGFSYANLVNVPSSQDPNLIRVLVGVLSGDPNNSLIIQKLEGTTLVGNRMPWGGPYLPQSTINVIRLWITNGAPNS